MSINTYFTRWNRNSVFTSGAQPFCGFELSTHLSEMKDREHIAQLLNYITNYCRESKKKLSPDETMNIGPWIVKFIEDSGMLHIHELDDHGEKFVPGVQFLNKVWLAQTKVCEDHQAEYSPVQTYQKVAWTKMVKDGTGPVDGVRYAAPEHMSGWYLFGEDYVEGNSDCLEVVQCGTALVARPDLAPFLGLPIGFRFRKNGDTEISFDPSVLANSVTSD